MPNTQSLFRKLLCVVGLGVVAQFTKPNTALAGGGSTVSAPSCVLAERDASRHETYTDCAECVGGGSDGWYEGELQSPCNLCDHTCALCFGTPLRCTGSWSAPFNWCETNACFESMPHPEVLDLTDAAIKGKDATALVDLIRSRPTELVYNGERAALQILSATGSVVGNYPMPPDLSGAIDDRLCRSDIRPTELDAWVANRPGRCLSSLDSRTQ